MVEFGYAFTITDNLGETSTFYLIEENIRAGYQKRRNFGEKRNIDLETFNVYLTWDDIDALSASQKTSVAELYDFFNEALENMPCYVSINYYHYPIVLDQESGQIVTPPATIETMFTPANFMKCVVDNMLVGTISYELTPVADKMSESVFIQLNKEYNPERFANLEQHKSSEIIEEGAI